MSGTGGSHGTLSVQYMVTGYGANESFVVAFRGQAMSGVLGCGVDGAVPYPWMGGNIAAKGLT
jgi:hypothetical protein